MPSAAAARHSRSPRPGCSAAASNSSVCVSAGSSRTRRTNRSSSWWPTGSGSSSGTCPRSCPGVSSRGGFHHGERVATRPGDDALRHVGVDGSVDNGREQLVRILLRQACEPKTWERLQTRVRLRRLPDREQHPDAVSQQPAGHEAEDTGGILVQPLRVVDHAQHRPHLGHVRKQRQHSQTDQERIGRRPGHQPEGHAQRPPLRPGQPVHAVQEGKEQAMDGGEAQAGLGLDSHYPDDLQVRGALGCVVEERRLPHSRLPPQDQRAAHAPADAVKDLADHLLLCAAVDQPHPTTIALIALV